MLQINHVHVDMLYIGWSPVKAFTNLLKWWLFLKLLRSQRKSRSCERR